MHCPWRNHAAVTEDGCKPQRKGAGDDQYSSDGCDGDRHPGRDFGRLRGPGWVGPTWHWRVRGGDGRSAAGLLWDVRRHHHPGAGSGHLYAAWGAWNLKAWAWTLLVVLTAIGLVLALFSLRSSFISLIVNAVILYYLFRPEVKAAFQRT